MNEPKSAVLPSDVAPAKHFVQGLWPQLEWRVWTKPSVGMWRADVEWRIGQGPWYTKALHLPRKPSDVQLKMLIKRHLSGVIDIHCQRQLFWSKSVVQVSADDNATCCAFVAWLAATWPERFRRAARATRPQRYEGAGARALVVCLHQGPQDLEVGQGIRMPVHLCNSGQRLDSDERSKIARNVVQRMETAYLRGRLKWLNGGKRYANYD